jgi:zinc/manganese transport system substrate-binding protein
VVERHTVPSRLVLVSLALLALALPVLTTGCGGGYAATAAASWSGRISVVAAENFWGSIATQLAGNRADVKSIIVNPAEDPHDYQATAADARSLVTAQLAIVNGIGYDPWASRLLAANPVPGRIVLDVGKRLRLATGDNPHRWYSPGDVQTIAGHITADLKRLDPPHAAYYSRQAAAFERQGLRRYRSLIASISQRYAGVPVGASESIFALLAPSLRLRLITPAGFMKSISEGTDVSAQDTIAAQRQIDQGQIKVWIYNAQNAAPQIQRLNALARAHGIPVATLTETLTPASDDFEHWQSSQLQRLAAALHQATGR